MAGDIKKHIAFLEVMGSPLAALFDMHGVPGGLHAFLRMSNHSYLSIVQLPEFDKIPCSWASPCRQRRPAQRAGTPQHLASRADTEERLLACATASAATGSNVLGPIDQGICRSIYFAGPTG
jgi:hypothetical protein